MTVKQEHILFFAFAVLAILLLWDLKNKATTVVDVSNTAPDQELYDPFASNIATPQNSAGGPAYLVYNQPYAFAPPTVMTLPRLTSGQIGQASVTLVAPDCSKGC